MRGQERQAPHGPLVGMRHTRSSASTVAANTNILDLLPTLRTEHLLFRPARRQLLPALLRRLGRLMRPLDAGNADQSTTLAAMLQRSQLHDLPPWRVSERQSGRRLAYVRFVNWRLPHSCAELLVAPIDEADGVGVDEASLSEAIAAATAFGFRELDLHRVEMLCMPNRTDIITAAERAGIHFEAMLRQYAVVNGSATDIVMMAAIRPL